MKLSPEAYVYAETAFHHEGDEAYLVALIRSAADSGVQGIKFQVCVDFNALISTAHPAYSTLSKYVFSAEQWRKAIDLARSLNLDVIVMPLDVESVRLAQERIDAVKYIELHSVAFNDQDLKDACRSSAIPLIIGAGGRTLDEIIDIKQYFGEQLKVVMTGFQAYPSKIADAKLLRIAELKRMFSDMIIGYADHSKYDDRWAVDSNAIAYTLGARMFEKHITLDEGEERVDYESAIGKAKMQEIVTQLRELEFVLNMSQDSFEMTEAEVGYRNRQKVAVAAHELRAGHVLREEDISLKMAGRFDGFFKKQDLIGRSLKVDIHQDNVIASNYVTD